MENRDFYDTIMEVIDYYVDFSNFSTSKNTFLSITRDYNLPDECLDEYDDKYDYKKIFLSHYFYKAWYDEELDFDGKPLATLASHEAFRELEAIMEKRESVAKYIESGVSLQRLVNLKEKYGLV